MQRHRLRQYAYPQLRSLHINEQLRLLSAALRRLMQCIHLIRRLSQRHMGEVQPDAGHPGPEHGFQRLHVCTGRSDGPVDLPCGGLFFHCGHNASSMFPIYHIPPQKGSLGSSIPKWLVHLSKLVRYF